MSILAGFALAFSLCVAATQEPRRSEGADSPGPSADLSEDQEEHPSSSMEEGPLKIPHSRNASGTAWQPDSTPTRAVHFMADDWMFMVHGLLFAGYDFQSTRRGGDEFLSTNWVMLMADHPLGGGDLGFRTMLSLEPATVGREGYPLLLQTGESLGGRPLHDVQHPHDLFMEVAALYRRPISEDLGADVYLAPAGEPALGPAAFPHRLSAMADPLAPLGHHWQDSTHISYGVLTGGLFTTFAKLEGSWFNGREPDENRWDFDLRRPDSYSGRLSVNPTRDWSFQVSAGHLRSPEELEPDVSLTRVTASATYNVPLGGEGNWASTAVWGQNRPEGETPTNSFLVETNLELDHHHDPFARVEFIRKSGQELVLGPPLEARTFGIWSLTAGYVYDFVPLGFVVPGLGASFTLDYLDPGLEPFYGHRTVYGFMVFLRLWPARMPEEQGGAGGHHH